MIEYDFPDIFKCQTCYGDGYLVMQNYPTIMLREIAQEARTFIISGTTNTTNYLHCPRCNGTGGSLNKLELFGDQNE